jgi:2-aminobenzoate-CoA ligase
MTAVNNTTYALQEEISRAAVTVVPPRTPSHATTCHPRTCGRTIEFTLPELRFPARLNAAAELVDRAVQRYGPDRPALRTPSGETWSYGDLQTRGNQVAQVLTEDLGLVTGQRVLLRSPNNPWTAAAWLGVLKAGGVVVATMAALRVRELTPIVERTAPSIVLVDHRFVADVDALPGRASLTVVEYGGTGPGRPGGARRHQIGGVRQRRDGRR